MPHPQTGNWIPSLPAFEFTIDDKYTATRYLWANKVRRTFLFLILIYDEVLSPQLYLGETSSYDNIIIRLMIWYKQLSEFCNFSSYRQGIATPTWFLRIFSKPRSEISSSKRAVNWKTSLTQHKYCVIIRKCSVI